MGSRINGNRVRKTVTILVANKWEFGKMGMFVEKQQKNRKWEFTFRKCKFQHKKELNVLNTEIAISKGKSLENCVFSERAAGAPKFQKSKWESAVFLKYLLFLSRINGNSEKWECTQILY